MNGEAIRHFRGREDPARPGQRSRSLLDCETPTSRITSMASSGDRPKPSRNAATSFFLRSSIHRPSRIVDSGMMSPPIWPRFGGERIGDLPARAAAEPHPPIRAIRRAREQDLEQGAPLQELHDLRSRDGGTRERIGLELLLGLDLVLGLLRVPQHADPVQAATVHADGPPILDDRAPDLPAPVLRTGRARRPGTSRRTCHCPTSSRSPLFAGPHPASGGPHDFIVGHASNSLRILASPSGPISF